jgi:hypothetical protein
MQSGLGAILLTGSNLVAQYRPWMGKYRNKITVQTDLGVTSPTGSDMVQCLPWTGKYRDKIVVQSGLRATSLTSSDLGAHRLS